MFLNGKVSIKHKLLLFAKKKQTRMFDSVIKSNFIKLPPSKKIRNSENSLGRLLMQLQTWGKPKVNQVSRYKVKKVISANDCQIIFTTFLPF